MFIALLELEFRVHGCHSLKDKRQRLSGLRDKFGALKHVAACEAAHQDSKTQAGWAFVLAGGDKAGLSTTANVIVEHCQHNVDAELVEQQLSWL